VSGHRGLERADGLHPLPQELSEGSGSGIGRVLCYTF